MTHSFLRRLIYLASFAALCAGGNLFAASDQVTLQCPNAKISVTANTAATAQRVCETVTQALPALSACHLPLQRQFHIQVVKNLSHPLSGNCLAIADCTDQIIKITAPDALPGVLKPSSVYTLFPTEALFDSLLVHELTHLLISQQPDPPRTVTDHEYMAYVMQMQTLPPHLRQNILDLIADSPQVQRQRLNVFLVLAKPLRFAAFAWKYHNTVGNGCDFFRRLLTHQDTLDIMPY